MCKKRIERVRIVILIFMLACYVFSDFNTITIAITIVTNPKYRRARRSHLYTANRLYRNAFKSAYRFCR